MCFPSILPISLSCLTDCPSPSSLTVHYKCNWLRWSGSIKHFNTHTKKYPYLFIYYKEEEPQLRPWKVCSLCKRKDTSCGMKIKKKWNIRHWHVFQWKWSKKDRQSSSEPPYIKVKSTCQRIFHLTVSETNAVSFWSRINMKCIEAT